MYIYIYIYIYIFIYIYIYIKLTTGLLLLKKLTKNLVYLFGIEMTI